MRGLFSPLLGPLSGGGAGTAVTYSAEAEALFARFTTPPTTARKALIDALIVALKDGGVWSKIDCLWMTAAADTQAARQNWKQDLYNLTPVSSPTFTADRGYTGDGATGYLDTGFAPSVHGVNFTLNSAHLAIYSLTDAQSTGISMGSRTNSGTAHSYMTLRNLTNVATMRINQDASSSTPASTNSSGGFVLRRSGSTAAALFRNGASLGTHAIVSTSLSTANIVIGALNTGGVVGNFNTYQFAAASIGASLTDAEITTFYNAKLAYLQAIGAS